ncbi:citrate lyase subunit beta, partial [Salmonella enterica subsp. enterica serovar Typhimurium]
MQVPRSAGIQAFDTVYFDANNEAGFLQEAAHIKQSGFDVTSLINLLQLELLPNPYAPTRTVVPHARLAVAAAEAASRDGLGAFSLTVQTVASPRIER